MFHLPDNMRDLTAQEQSEVISFKKRINHIVSLYPAHSVVSFLSSCRLSPQVRSEYETP